MSFRAHRLLGCDIYSFDFKINHIARHIQLPDPPLLGPEARLLPPSQQIPPLLVLNIQLPMYLVSAQSSVRSGLAHMCLLLVDSAW
jgi:hypothetical protein